MATDVGRAPSGQALVASDGVATHLHRPGVDPSRKPWPLSAYAPGNYFCSCIDCGKQFEGDKRALQCLECAAAAMNASFTAFSRALRIEVWNREKERGASDAVAMRAIQERIDAIAMEAASTGETEGLDGNRDSAGLEGIAQTQSDEGMQ